MTKMDISLGVALPVAEDPQAWAPPEAPLEMPRQMLEAERDWRSVLAPLRDMLMFRTRA